MSFQVSVVECHCHYGVYIQCSLTGENLYRLLTYLSTLLNITSFSYNILYKHVLVYQKLKKNSILVTYIYSLIIILNDFLHHVKSALYKAIK